MKIELITLHNIKNYGSMLQAFATQELLKAQGFEVEVIDYTRKDANFWNHIFAYSKYDSVLIKILKSCVLFPTELRYFFLWNCFKGKKINSSKNKYSSYNQLLASPPQGDIYCTGSDQVWNSRWNGGILKEFFLDFAPKDRPRYAIAASLGTSEIAEKEKAELYSLLKKYKLISVRESSGVKALKSLGINDVKEILDPTLTIDKEFWEIFAGKRKKRKSYILLYQLGSDSNFEVYAKKIAKQMGIGVLRICIRYDQILRFGRPIVIPSFQRFISLFIDAKCVITDSFHATCFSLNFQRDFYCILPEKYQGRIVDLLHELDLVDRIVNLKLPEKVVNSICYADISEKIEQRRHESKSFYQQIKNDSLKETM